MKRINSICISVFFLLVLTVSCDRLKSGNEDCEKNGHSYYQFNLPFYYSSHTDTIQLGDTLWIESKFSNQLYNEKNGKTHTLNAFNFGMDVAISDLSTNPTIGYSGFVLVDTLGQIDNTNKNGAHFNVNYDFANDTYYWKKGIVLNKSGAFYITIASNLSGEPLSNSGQSITNCRNEHVDVRDKRMNGNNNYYLVETSPDPYITQGEAVFENCFIFYVKE